MVARGSCVVVARGSCVVVARGSRVVLVCTDPVVDPVAHSRLLHNNVIPPAASRVDALLELNLRNPVLEREHPFTFVELEIVSDVVSLAPTASAAASHSEALVMEQWVPESSHWLTCEKLKAQYVPEHDEADVVVAVPRPVVVRAFPPPTRSRRTKTSGVQKVRPVRIVRSSWRKRIRSPSVGEQCLALKRLLAHRLCAEHRGTSRRVEMPRYLSSRRLLEEFLSVIASDVPMTAGSAISLQYINHP